MEWWMVLILFFCTLIFLMFLGLPVAFAFLAVNLIFVSFTMGFHSGIEMMVLSAYDSIAKFSLTPIPLFIIMGELLFHSGLVMRTLDVLSKWLGKLPGRLAVLSVGSGTLFSALSGSSIANTSMLGAVLVPEMLKRGYHTTLTISPILASGLLAAIIPPSAMAVLLGSLGKVSIGSLLIAGIVPGVLLAFLFVGYFIFICWRDPTLAPTYEVDKSPWKDKIASFLKDVLPMLVLIFLVLGLFFLGIATPTESAAIGALGALVLLLFNKKLNMEVIKKSTEGTIIISGMILLIIATAGAFSQLLSFTGATRELIEIVTGSNLSPLLLILLMLIIVLLLGMFIEQIAIMMITLPLYMPLVISLEYDPIGFGILMLICLGIGNLSPPFGLLLFVIKGVVPKSISMGTIYRSVMPIIVIQLIVVVIILVFPEIATWLPSLGKTGS